jgi:hypothetical protein
MPFAMLVVILMATESPGSNTPLLENETTEADRYKQQLTEVGYTVTQSGSMNSYIRKPSVCGQHEIVRNGPPFSKGMILQYAVMIPMF